ncbi:fasciclin-like arabinogalactan protein 12 [Euphorbia lathyris]|uniref:fasciclin-like arabinogalactan protein 12 n=1 Tax=Euphorbia lathyris TaxID=212925 RepID=UPI003314190F
MKQHSINLLSFLLLLMLFHFTKLQALSPATAPAPAARTHAAPPRPPAAAAPAPVMVPVQPSKGPLNVVKVLQKAGHFAFFVRLIKSTQEDLQLFSQLNDSSDGVTIFAPTDNAFSSIIKSGTLNSLSDQQKIELVQFHIIPKFLSISQFQYVSNPLKTLAGSGSRLPLNVTTSDNLVNVTTGPTRTYVSGIVYTDEKVGIYQVDKVLLPLDLFGPKPPAPAPAAPKPKKDEDESDGEESPVVPDDISGGVISSIRSFHDNLIVLGVIGLVGAMFSL